ncbi:MAG TPA: hypothetical protein VL916_05480 [Ilumatobacteraceae bacterium]|nr:hypothetical protein [Ilumatobacteraceae bacterium]
MKVRAVALALGLAAGGLLWTSPVASPVAHAACGGGQLTTAQLNATFAVPNVGGSPGVLGYAGGDYQHVYALPDGRNLWLFQDMFFSADNDLRDSLGAAAHNAGLVQNGSCWSMLGGPGMKNYIGSSLTTPLRRWFWPMDGEIGADGALWVFMAEMRNSRGTGAGYGALPYATWVARIDPSSLAVLSFVPAADAGTRLYGWSVTSDNDWSYLYGHCYRQFLYNVNSVGQFDSACMPHTYLARVPKGQFGAARQYWTAGGWSNSPNDAKPLMTRGAANPMDVQKFGDVYVNVTKVDDWWGAWVYVDKAPNPWGPWQLDRSIWIVNERRCSECGIYHAHLLPYLDNGQMVLSWSNGAPYHLWQQNAFLYRPAFVSVPLPTFRTDAPVTGAGMQPRAPVRAVDTRQTKTRMRGATMIEVPLAGLVPNDAVGVVANLTAVNPAGAGFLTAWACGARMPPTSVLNYRAGKNTANAVHLRIDPSQKLCIYASVDTDVLVDVTGSYRPSTGAGPNAMTAARVADTTGGAPLAAGGTLTVPIIGVAGVPASGVDAVSVTVTASQPSGYGYLTVWPCGQTMPVVSTLNFVAGDTVTNSATMPAGSGGAICVYSPVATHVAVDVAAWWTAAGPRARLASSERAIDTRSGSRPTAGSTLTVPLASFVPAGASIAVTNLISIGPTGAGALVASDCGVTPSGVTVAYVAGEVRPGVALTSLSANREVCVATTADAHVVVDVMVSFGG